MSTPPEGAVPTYLFAQAVQDRLDEIAPDLWTSLGEPDGVPTLNGQPGSRVVPYAAIYPSASEPDLTEEDLAHHNLDLTFEARVTVAAGYVPDLLTATDQVRNALYRWEPTINGPDGRPLVFGPMRPPLGYRAGAMQTDRDVNPHRVFIPLIYVTTLTTT